MTTNHFRIGIDEVGNGCLLGPLVVAAVVNPLEWHDPEVKDSKQVASEKKRYRIADEICANTMWAIASVWPDAINKFGISESLIHAYDHVIRSLVKRVRDEDPTAVIEIILDGVMIREIKRRFHHPPSTTVVAIVKADATVFESSAASLIAKATRDRWCHQISKERPELEPYHLPTNKGYDSPNHTKALIQFGLTDLHRTVYCRTRLINEATKRKQPITMKMPDGSQVNIMPITGDSCTGSLLPHSP